jgi:hypothetical protein
MSNANDSFFDKLGDDVVDAKEKLLGPSYDYVGNIRLPSEMGMSSKGDLRTLGKDIEGLAAYLQLLVSGGGPASKARGPMGNKFFLETGARCLARQNDDGSPSEPREVSRDIYINNIPQGHIPLISAGVGANFTEFRGLVPGVLENLNAFNPISMFTALTGGMTPDCQLLEMEEVDSKNNSTNTKRFVTNTDIESMDACWFLKKDGRRMNPITKEVCRMTFMNMDGTNGMEAIIPKDMVSQGIFASFGILGIYIAFKGMQKMNLIPK